MRVTRRHVKSQHLTLGDLRQIVADAERWELGDDALVNVDDQHDWIPGVDENGNPSKPYPQGNGGHYRTSVTVKGESAGTTIPLTKVHVVRDLREV